MVRKKVVRAINLLRESLERRNIKIDKLILFGSQIKGKPRFNSDIDIVIISSDFKGKDIFARANITGDAHWEVVQKVLIPLDIIAMTPEEWQKGASLITDYAKEGKVIYG